MFYVKMTNIEYMDILKNVMIMFPITLLLFVLLYIYIFVLLFYFYILIYFCPILIGNLFSCPENLHKSYFVYFFIGWLAVF